MSAKGSDFLRAEKGFLRAEKGFLPSQRWGNRLKTTDQVLHERMTRRPFTQFEAFDVASFVKMGKKAFGSHNDGCRGGHLEGACSAEAAVAAGLVPGAQPGAVPGAAPLTPGVPARPARPVSPARPVTPARAPARAPAPAPQPAGGVGFQR